MANFALKNDNLLFESFFQKLPAIKYFAQKYKNKNIFSVIFFQKNPEIIAIDDFSESIFAQLGAVWLN